MNFRNIFRPCVLYKISSSYIFNACVDLRLRIALLRKNVAIVCGQGNCCHKSTPFVVRFWLNIAGYSGKIKGVPGSIFNRAT